VETLYLGIAWAIILIVAAAKILDAWGSARVLNQQDPVFDLEQRYVLFGAGIVELVVCSVLPFMKRRLHQLLLVGWLATMFMFYRAGHLWLGPTAATCPCLGRIGEWWPAIAPYQSNIALGLFLYLLIGSYVFIFVRHREIEVTKPTVLAEIKAI
jgi:hypothetical protein